MKLLPLLLLICLDCGAQKSDTLYVVNKVKLADGSIRTNLSDGNYRVAFAAKNGLSGGGLGTGIYRREPVIIDTTKPSYQSIDYISTEFHNWGSRIQLITEMRGKKDTSVYIQGDTMQLIKSMFIFYLKTMAEKDSIIRELRKPKQNQ